MRNTSPESSHESERILSAWNELQAAIKAAPENELRSIIMKDLGLDLKTASRALAWATGRLAAIGRTGDSEALKVLEGGCFRIRRALSDMVIPKTAPPISKVDDERDLQAVRLEYNDAIDDLIDIVRLGQPGAIEVLLRSGSDIAGLLEDLVSSQSDDAPPFVTPEKDPQRTNSGRDGMQESGWQRRLDEAIESLLKEEPGKISEAFRKAKANLPESRFSIQKLSSKLPDFKHDDPDISTLYDLLDQLVDQRLMPRKGRSVILREFLDGARTPYDAGLHSGTDVSPLKNPARATGSPSDFALQVYEGITAMRTRWYPLAHLDEFRMAKDSNAATPILQQLKKAKAEDDRRVTKRRDKESVEEWLCFRSPNAILEQLVALLPPFGKASINDWLDASVAFVFVSSKGDFEKCTWPASVMLALKESEGLPSAIRKTLRKGFEALANANSL